VAEKLPHCGVRDHGRKQAINASQGWPQYGDEQRSAVDKSTLAARGGKQRCEHCHAVAVAATRLRLSLGR